MGTSCAIALMLTHVSLPAHAQSFAGTGSAGSSTKGGSRGSCPSTGKPLTPLVPASAPNGGWTMSANPTFWVYVPYTLTPEHTVEFVLLDDQNQLHYQTRFAGTGSTPGILGLSLPAKATPLDEGKVYTWYVMVYCDRQGDLPASASATIQRVPVDATLKQQLAKASPLEQSRLYANRRLWYDALTVLSTARLTPNSQATTAWRALLTLPTVALQSFIAEPVQLAPTP